MYNIYIIYICMYIYIIYTDIYIYIYIYILYICNGYISIQIYKCKIDYNKLLKNAQCPEIVHASIIPLHSVFYGIFTQFLDGYNL